MRVGGFLIEEVLELEEQGLIVKSGGPYWFAPTDAGLDLLAEEGNPEVLSRAFAAEVGDKHLVLGLVLVLAERQAAALTVKADAIRANVAKRAPFYAASRGRR